MFILAAIFTIGIIGALLLVRNKKPEETNALFSEASYEDKPTEDNMSHIYEAKELPAIDEKYPQEESQENQTWEEDGFYWSVAPDGTLSYFDEASQSWILYQN